MKNARSLARSIHVCRVCSLYYKNGTQMRTCQHIIFAYMKHAAANNFQTIVHTFWNSFNMILAQRMLHNLVWLSYYIQRNACTILNGSHRHRHWHTHHIIVYSMLAFNCVWMREHTNHIQHCSFKTTENVRSNVRLLKNFRGKYCQWQNAYYIRFASPCQR